MYNQALNLINKGRKGYFKGLSFNKPILSQDLPNIQHGTYYLLAGDTGTGKTSLADDMFVFSPIEQIVKTKEAKLSILYYSLEIDPKIKEVKFIARKLYDDYGITIDVNTLLSRGKYNISNDIYDKIVKLEPYFSQFDTYINYIDRAVDRNEFENILKKDMLKRGKLVKDGDNLKVDTNHYYIVIVDHVSLVKGNNKKETIDSISSEVLVPYRNRYGIIPVVIQQLNRGMTSNERFKGKRVKPTMSDLKDSGNPAQDANAVLAVFDPFKYEQGLDNYYNYGDIRKLLNKFRSLFLIKNRDGNANTHYGLDYVGEVGKFIERKGIK